MYYGTVSLHSGAAADAELTVSYLSLESAAVLYSVREGLGSWLYLSLAMLIHANGKHFYKFSF